MVRRAGGRRPDEQVFDGRLRVGYCRRLTVHAGAQGFRTQVDLDCRRAGLADLPAEPRVERSPRLAVRAVDAQHQRQRPRRCSESGSIHPATNPDGEPVRPSTVAGGTGLAVLWQRGTALSRSRLGVRGDAGVLHDEARQGLLRRSGVSHAVRGRRCGLRTRGSSAPGGPG